MRLFILSIPCLSIVALVVRGSSSDETQASPAADIITPATSNDLNPSCARHRQALTLIHSPETPDATTSSPSSSSPISSILRITFSPLQLALNIANPILEPIGLARHTREASRRLDAWVDQRSKKRDHVHQGQVDVNRISRLLKEATEVDGCERAWVDRALWALLPASGDGVDIPIARHALQQSVSTTSNATAQFLAGFLHAADLNTTSNPSQSLALLHYTFAAYQGLAEAEMTLGYRHWAGISVKEDCQDALDWYEAAAERSYAHFLAGPPGGRTLPLTPLKLTDAQGGIYGPGASWASTGPNAQRAAIRAAQQLGDNSDDGLEDVLEWYRYQSDREDAWKTVYLGKVFYMGSAYSIAGGLASGAEGVGAVERDYTKARSYFLQVARGLWPRDPPMPLADDFGAKQGRRESAMDQLSGPAALAATYLGRMHLRGEGVPQDFVLARMWLKRASDMGLAEAHNMLGIIWRDGLGVKTLPAKALHYFKAAAGMELAEAKTNLGKLQLDLPGSVALFTQAIQAGNNYEAYFYLAKMHARDARAKPDQRGVCGAAVAFFKNVAERGRWQWDYLGDAERAWQRGDRQRALVGWWIASEMGYEVAQNNVAYLLEQQGNKDSALTHWIRSAGQQNVDAVVRVGDYAYEGLMGDESSRYETAAGWYQSAADTQASAIAFWNLGWMYENGLGVAQDFHLAKRYYDLCRETDSEADLPALLSLVKLHVRSWWSRFLGGKQEALAWGDAEEMSPRRRPTEGDTSDDPSLDLVEWSRRRQQDELAGYDDYLETGRTARQRHAADLEFEFDEELADMIMIGLIAAVAAIALYRAHRQRNRPEPDAAAPPLQPPLPFAPLP